MVHGEFGLESFLCFWDQKVNIGKAWSYKKFYETQELHFGGEDVFSWCEATKGDRAKRVHCACRSMVLSLLFMG